VDLTHVIYTVYPSNYKKYILMQQTLRRLMHPVAWTNEKVMNDLPSIQNCLLKEKNNVVSQILYY